MLAVGPEDENPMVFDRAKVLSPNAKALIAKSLLRHLFLRVDDVVLTDKAKRTAQLVTRFRIHLCHADEVRRKRHHVLRNHTAFQLELDELELGVEDALLAGDV